MLTFGRKKILMMSLGYIYIPIVIFLFGWTKLYIAIICSAALLFGMVILYQDYTAMQTEDFYIKKSSFFIVVLFFLIIGYYAGWGEVYGTILRLVEA